MCLSVRLLSGRGVAVVSNKGAGSYDILKRSFVKFELKISIIDSGNQS